MGSPIFTQSVAAVFLCFLLWHEEFHQWILPSGYVKIAIENGPVEIVDLPIENGDYSIVM